MTAPRVLNSILLAAVVGIAWRAHLLSAIHPTLVELASPAGQILSIPLELERSRAVESSARPLDAAEVRKRVRRWKKRRGLAPDRRFRGRVGARLGS